jgi:hypothetical protein
MRVGRWALGRVLWVTFLARARKVTRAAEGRAKAFALQAKIKSKNWIPAFAGMTS